MVRDYVEEDRSFVEEADRGEFILFLHGAISSRGDEAEADYFWCEFC